MTKAAGSNPYQEVFVSQSFRIINPSIKANADAAKLKNNIQPAILFMDLRNGFMILWIVYDWQKDLSRTFSCFFWSSANCPCLGFVDHCRVRHNLISVIAKHRAPCPVK
jgi:hypothetical protein